MKKKKKNDFSAVNSMIIRRPMKRWFPVFIMPTFICFIIGFVWPFIQGIYLSFCNFNTPKDAKWVGFSNYVKAFSDKGFQHAFWNTAAFAVVSIILINVLAFAIAYALTQKMRGANLFRTVFFMPNLIGGVVLGYIWSLIFDAILKGYSTFLTLTNSFKLFDQNLALTGGMPSVMTDGSKVNMTELLALNIYSTYNINKNWHGAAQAKAVVFFLLVAALAQLTATRSKEVQQ